MKKQSNLAFVEMSRAETNDLAKTVNETIAKGFITKKNFSVIDLWNIQRRSKTAVNSRKMYLRA